MPLAGGISAGLNLVGGIIGGEAQRDAATQFGDAEKAAIAGYFYKLDQVGMPPDQSAPLVLNLFKQSDRLTPELEQYIKEAASHFQNIKQNQQALQFQQQALQRLSQLGRAGITPEERAQQRELQAETARQAEAQQQQIIQNLAARGQGGGGAEIAARLSASQAAAQQASANADRISALGAQRALQAIASGGSLAGQMEAQQFGEQAQQAQAADIMNRFNIENQANIQQRNVASKNLAQQYNVQNLQNISNMNVAQANQELHRQLQAKRQQWLDKLEYARSYQSPYTQYGNAAAQQGYGEQKALGDMWGGAFGALGKGVSSVFGNPAANSGSTPMNSATFNPNVSSADIAGPKYQFGSKWKLYGP